MVFKIIKLKFKFVYFSFYDDYLNFNNRFLLNEIKN